MINPLLSTDVSVLHDQMADLSDRYARTLEKLYTAEATLLKLQNCRCCTHHRCHDCPQTTNEKLRALKELIRKKQLAERE